MKYGVCITLCIALLLRSGTANALSPAKDFLPMQSIGLAGMPSVGMAIGDVDDDGDIDILVANDGAENRLYRNRGNATFTIEYVSADSLKTRDIKAVDMDNDGDLDIITAEGAASGIVSSKLYLNDGTGHFGSGINFENHSAPYYGKSIAAGDLNGDGKIDVVIAYYGKNRVCLQDTITSWTCGDLSDANNHTASIAIADIDRDGRLDVVTANTNTYNFVYFNNGSSDPPTMRTFSGSSEHSYALAVGDLNHDGKPDIVVGNYNGINRLYQFKGTRIPQTSSNLGNFTHKTYGISLGDIDRDGDLDVLIANNRQDNLLMKNRGNGYFQEGDAFLLQDPGESYRFVIADFNRDGKNDLACANNYGSNALFLHKHNSLSLLMAPVIAGAHNSSPPSSPAAPSHITATAMNDTFGIILHWHDNSNNENNFLIYRSETNNFNDAVRTTITAPNLTSIAFFHLDPCKRYYFWVAAKNTTGQSVSANYATAMTAPDAPEDVYTTNYTIRSTMLYWRNNVDQCTVRYHVYAKAPEDDSYTQIPDGDTLTDGSVGSVNVGITPETYIYYRVAAENNDGTIGPMSCTVKSGYRAAYAYNHAGCNAAVGYAFGDKPKYPWASMDKNSKVIFTWDDVPIQYNSNGSAVSLYANCFRIAYKIGAGGWVHHTDCLQNPITLNNWQYQRFEINQLSADISATLRISTHYLYDTDGDGNKEDVYSEPITITGRTLPNGSGGGGVAALGTTPWVTASHYFPGKIMVGWTTSSNATSYQVYRGNWNGSCAGTSYGSYRTFSAGQSSFDDMVGDWKQFCYKVRACNNGVCTAFSTGEYGNSGGL